LRKEMSSAFSLWILHVWEEEKEIGLEWTLNKTLL
jgi:hypothetical protein